MTSTLLIQWIEHPETLDKDSLYELRTLVARYPYFQSIRLLYLKNLYLLHDATFGEELRKSLLYIADRRMLFYQIEGERYALHAQPSEEASLASSENSGIDRTLYLIDSYLASMPEEQLPAAELDYSMDYTAYLLKSDDDVPVSQAVTPVEEVPQLRGQSLIDDFLSKADEPLLSLEEQINASAATASAEVEVLKAVPPASSESNQTEKLPEIEECSDEEESKVTEIQSEDETFTETLAKIYVKQHRYDKALEIIKKLSLNYPKKNAYFADQIRFLEKLIINAKSK
ncbi:hypothetical protein EVA_07707 [gut metagenome]|uniref:Tetratricopeptide repeat protein n=1 Tax=gut metagenome TaxID=749906 RepID=J9GP90_9ZZZZ